MGWLIKRLIAWAVAGALIATFGATVWYSVKITNAGYSLSSVPATTMAFDVMQLHVFAAAGAGVGFLLGLLGRLWRRLRIRLAGLFSREPAPVERVDPDAMIRAERRKLADDYLATLEKRALDNVVVSTEDADGGPDVENVITARNGRFTYRVLAYRHLSVEERKQIVQEALERGHVQEPEPGGTATIQTSVGKPD